MNHSELFTKVKQILGEKIPAHKLCVVSVVDEEIHAIIKSEYGYVFKNDQIPTDLMIDGKTIVIEQEINLIGKLAARHVAARKLIKQKYVNHVDDGFKQQLTNLQNNFK